MAYLRQLSSHFDPVYIKPANITRAVTLLRTNTIAPYSAEQQLPPRRKQDRRCGIDRRRQQRPILLDTRCPHARRKQYHRRQQDHFSSESVAGIDVYA
jgi:hypothetical protein